MIINNTFKFIFVHVPKSAGTSLTNFLSGLSCYCDIEVGASALGESLQAEYAKRYKLSKHSTAQEIRSVVGDVLWKRYFSFGVVRNPYRRTHSIYRFMRTMSSRGIRPYLEIDRFPSFRDFALSDYFQEDGPDRIFRPQFFWLRQAHPNGELAVDFVGRVESLDEDIATVLRSVGLPDAKQTAAAMPRLNVSVADDLDVQQALDGDSALEQAISSRYEIDFSNFKYERGRA